MLKRLRKRVDETVDLAHRLDPFEAGIRSTDRGECWSSDAPPAPGDLKGYAEARGLRWSREGALAPAYCLFDIERGRDVNTCRGFVDGRFIVLGHRLRKEVIYGGPGPTAGGAVAGNSVQARVEEAHTFAAVQVPATKTTLVAMNARAAQLVADRSGPALDELPNHDGWRLDLHPRTNRAVFDAVWHGPAGGVVRERLGWGPASGINRRPQAGGKFDVRAGIVSVWVPGYLEDHGALDDLVVYAGEVAQHVAVACQPALRPQPFEHPLPGPSAWMQTAGRSKGTLAEAVERVKVKRVKRGAFEAGDVTDAGAFEDDRWAGVRDFASAYASSRGLVLEDGRTFDEAFPSLPFNGWTQFAGRGTLPDGGPYRVALSALRPYVWNPLISAAGIMAIAPAPGRPDEPLRLVDGVYYAAVTAGMRCVIQYFSQMRAGHAEIDEQVARLAAWR